MPPASADDRYDLLERQLFAACVLEATARKPGNVHPGQSFADLCYDDFVKSAAAAAPILARALELGVGRAIRDAVAATRAQVSTNTNLGIILLLAPLAAVPPSDTLTTGIPRVLAGLTQRDAELVYEAIRLAQPGGLGDAPEQDVRKQPTGSLVEVMRLAADRDLIAREYALGFPIVLRLGLPELTRHCPCFPQDWELAIIALQLEILSRHADSLIVRKCGTAVAAEASHRARAAAQAAWISKDPRPDLAGEHPALLEFDRWLRGDGHHRNPGTTADLIAASLFAALRDGGLPLVLPGPVAGTSGLE